MTFETHLGGRVRLANGDSRDVLKALPDNSIDSVVTDPPYALVSIVKRFGGENAAPARDGDVYARASAGFMGKTWDTGETAFAVEFWAEVMRVLKPGGHVIAASGTRTYHRLAVAIEDAGFEIRDMISWFYGSGFPKSHDVSKGMDKALGATGSFGEPKSAAHAGWIDRGRMRGEDGHEGYQRPWMQDKEAVSNAARRYVPATPEAAAWQGWGTALKPACEPWVLARKPLVGTVAANVLAHGTGALNIDGCRVGSDVVGWGGAAAGGNTWDDTNCRLTKSGEARPVEGRWPANLIHDGSDEVVDAFPYSGGQRGAVGGQDPATNVYGDYGPRPLAVPRGDSGSAARFFYSAKADAMDRIGSKHPTVKPVDLMQYLCRLVTPPGGTILDPFAGSGTTGEAAWREGFDCVLIEREEEYAADIRERLRLAETGEATRRRAVAAKRATPVPTSDVQVGLFE